MAVHKVKLLCVLHKTPNRRYAISAYIGKLLSQKPPRKCFEQQKKKKKHFCTGSLVHLYVYLKPDNELNLHVHQSFGKIKISLELITFSITRTND